MLGGEAIAPSVPGSVRYMMLRRISVVMTTMSRSTLRVASPGLQPHARGAKAQAHLKQLLIAQRLEGRGVDDPLPPACQNAPIESLFFCLRTCQHDAVGLAPSKASVMTQVLAQGDMSRTPTCRPLTRAWPSVSCGHSMRMPDVQKGCTAAITSSPHGNPQHLARTAIVAASAITVLPAPVGALTTTEEPCKQDDNGLRLESVQLEGQHTLDVRQRHVLLARGQQIRHLHPIFTFTCLA